MVGPYLCSPVKKHTHTQTNKHTLVSSNQKCFNALQKDQLWHKISYVLSNVPWQKWNPSSKKMRGLNERENKRPGGHKTEIEMTWRVLGSYETMGVWDFESGAERE